MDAGLLQELSIIIEQDFTDTTYKYALLRATSEICQHYSHLREEDNGKVWFPLGLLVELWMTYYYPIIASEKFIPQKHKEKPLKEKGRNLSFRKQFKKITDHYKENGGINALLTAYKHGSFSPKINHEVFTLLRKLRKTIAEYPMKHFGVLVHKQQLPQGRPL